MSHRNRLTRVTGSFVLAVALTAVAAFALPVLAWPGGYLRVDPTPTLPQMQEVAYELRRVGGEDKTLTFNLTDQGDFMVGETSVTSRYPRGMIFTVAPQSANGRIADVTLYYRFVHDSGARHKAEYNPEAGQWVAHIWPTGEGKPAFIQLRCYWRIRDETGAYIDTEAFEVDYWDPDHEWFRMESDDIVLYWFGFMEDDPDHVAQGVAERMAAATVRLTEGFGRTLDYKPVTIVYPDQGSLGEIFAAGVTNNQSVGFTSSDLGVSVQVLIGPPPDDEPFECIWALPPAEWILEWRVEVVFDTAPHEIAHLYQLNVIGYAPGNLWVSEGQAEFFANNFNGAWERLPFLATQQDIPSLMTDISAYHLQSDGCGGLAYLVGAAFWNYLNIHYGGMETLAEIIRMQRQQKSIYEAVETVTGKPFLEVENEWRVTYGFEPLTLAEIDPASALEPYEDNLIAVGDVITLPAVPPLTPMKDKPGPKGLPGPQCFADTPVTVQMIGALDGTPYYQIDCMGMVGWITRDQLISD